MSDTLLDRKVTAMPLSPRVVNLLKSANIQTLEDIMRHERLNRLIFIEGFGPEALREVKAAIMVVLDIRMVIE